MKSSWFALILFLLLLGFIIFNFIFVNRRSDELVKAAEALPAIGEPECAEAAAELASFWESSSVYISFSCGVSEIEHITDLCDSLCVYAESGNACEFERIRRMLVNAFIGISAFESFHADDIF